MENTDKLEYIVISVDEKYDIDCVLFDDLSEAQSFFGREIMPILLGTHVNAIDDTGEIIPGVDDIIMYTPIFVQMVSCDMFHADCNGIHVNLPMIKKLCKDLNRKWLVGITYSSKLDSLIEVRINDNLSEDLQ